MTEDEVRNILDFCNSLVGKTVSAGDALGNLQFVRESKRQAKTHEWLYHCTTAAAIKSILKNREFWLSNLRLVNDKEEAGRIDVPEYENTYYICCFTYDSVIPIEHWEEYGSTKDGILIAVKPEWFVKQAVFMCGDNHKCEDEFFRIFKNYDTALKYKWIEQQNRRLINPFFINAFGFYQIVYDDTLKKNIGGLVQMEIDGKIAKGRSISPDIPGIIKSTHGICHRAGKNDYEKDWTAEKEVRLKVGIQQMDIVKNGYEIHDGMILSGAYAPKVAVPVSDDAFKEIRIKFSPKFEQKDEFMEDLKNLMPASTITVIS